MVLLINLIPWLVIGSCLLIGMFVKSTKVRARTLAILVIFLIVYPKVQPSYMPKGNITRSEVPAFEPTQAVIEDRNRKPVPSEERQAKQDQQYKDGLPWSQTK